MLKATQISCLLILTLFFSNAHTLGAKAHWKFILDTSLWEWGAEIRPPQFQDDAAQPYAPFIHCEAVSPVEGPGPIEIYNMARGVYECSQTDYAGLAPDSYTVINASIEIFAAGEIVHYEPMYTFDPWALTTPQYYGGTILLHLDKDNKLSYREIR